MTTAVGSKSATAARKELDRSTRSLENLRAKIATTQAELEKALHSGDTSGSVRIQTELAALQALAEREEQHTTRLTEEVAVLDAEAAQAQTLRDMVSRANEAVKRQREGEVVCAQVNDILRELLPQALEHFAAVARCRINFIAAARELGTNMGQDALPDEHLRQLRELGAENLDVVLSHWSGTPSCVTERRYEAPVPQPYGPALWQLFAVCEYERSLEARRADERERYGETSAEQRSAYG